MPRDLRIFRVLNVIRQWVDKYFNDLVESNDPLLERLKTFLQSIPDTGGFYPIKTSILKLIEKQVSSESMNECLELENFRRSIIKTHRRKVKDKI